MQENNIIKSRKQLREWLAYEKKRMKYKKNFILELFNASEKGIIYKYIKTLRKTEFCHNTNKKLRYYFYMIKLNRLQNKYGIKIPMNSCGKGLLIMHVGPILINSKAKLGADCAIHVGVKIVAGGTNDGVPQIGNNCVIGVGAALIGDIQIANGIAVGANSVVNKSFLEENIAIAGVPAKKISNNGASTWNKKSKQA